MNSSLITTTLGTYTFLANFHKTTLALHLMFLNSFSPLIKGTGQGVFMIATLLTATYVFLIAFIAAPPVDIECLVSLPILYI